MILKLFKFNKIKPCRAMPCHPVVSHGISILATWTEIDQLQKSIHDLPGLNTQIWGCYLQIRRSPDLRHSHIAFAYCIGIAFAYCIRNICQMVFQDVPRLNFGLRPMKTDQDDLTKSICLVIDAQARQFSSTLIFSIHSICLGHMSAEWAHVTESWRNITGIATAWTW